MTKDEGPLTITDAAGFIRKGELTPVELLEQCLARMNFLDKQDIGDLDRLAARARASQHTAARADRGYCNGLEKPVAQVEAGDDVEGVARGVQHIDAATLRLRQFDCVADDRIEDDLEIE